VVATQCVICDEVVQSNKTDLGEGRRGRLRFFPLSPQQATSIRLYALMGAIGIGTLVCVALFAFKALHGL
jgi:hypothetical protein